MSSEGHTDPGWCEEEARRIIAAIDAPLIAPLDSPTPNRDNVIWLAEKLKSILDRTADIYASGRG